VLSSWVVNVPIVEVTHCVEFVLGMFAKNVGVYGLLEKGFLGASIIVVGVVLLVEGLCTN